MSEPEQTAVRIDSGTLNRRAPDRVDPRLLEILVCPVTRGTLRYDAERQELMSDSAKLAFPIRGGVPVMLTDDARPI